MSDQNKDSNINKLVIKDNSLYNVLDEQQKESKIKLVRENSDEEISISSNMAKFLDQFANKSIQEIGRDNSKVFIFPYGFIESKMENEDEKSYIVKVLKNGTKIKTLTTQNTGNIVGFLGGNVKSGKTKKLQQLVIKSRFDSDDKEFFLLYMLGKALKIPYVHSLKLSANPQDRALEYYVFLFPFYLREAMKKGPYKTYVRRHYNDTNVKGVIDVRRHITQNMPFAGKIAYSQREFSYDNYLMELIRHTIEFIKKRYGKEFFSGIKEYVKQIEELTPNYNPSHRNQIIRENKKNIVRSAYFSSYKIIQELCIWILEFKKIGMGGIDSNQVFGVLFDAAWIWEEYINTLINDKFYHPQNKEMIGTQHLFKGKRTYSQEIYPDFIGKNTEERVIADAKYKPISNIGRDDYFQVLAYMLRFDAVKGYYLYPERNNEKNDDKFEILKGIEGFGEDTIGLRYDKKLVVIKHGLKIPKVSGEFSEFEKQMKENEKEFISVLK